jgi:hypothetical protein
MLYKFIVFPCLLHAMPTQSSILSHPNCTQDFRFSQQWLWRVGPLSFWDVTPCSPVVHRRFGGFYCLQCQRRRESQARHHQDASRNLYGFFLLVFCVAYSSSMNMDAVGSSETSMNRTTWRYTLLSLTIYSAHPIRKSKCLCTESSHQTEEFGDQGVGGWGAPLRWSVLMNEVIKSSYTGPQVPQGAQPLFWTASREN